MNLTKKYRFYAGHGLFLDYSTVKLPRGVRQEYITEILERFTPELEAQQAANAAELFVQRNRKKLAQAEPHDKKIYAAAGRFMASRGFSMRYMHILLERLHFEDDI